MSSFADLEKKIEEVREEYYGETGKSFFFKKQQKYNFAKQLVSQIPIDTLLQRTCWIVPNKHIVFIDYPIMKSYASPETFDYIADHIINTCDYVKRTTNSLEVALNLDGFTVSAAERYKSLIETFCNKCFQQNMGFSQILSRFVIYNTPPTIESVKPIVISLLLEEVKSKIQLVGKKESEVHLHNLYSSIQHK